MNPIKKFLTDYRSTPILLLALTLLSFGLLIPFVGLYMDDWYILWFKHVFGILEYPRYFALDRPLMGYFYLVVSYLLGGSETPWVWQVFALITRWLATYALWGMLNTLWPAAKRQNTWVALLAAIFPGFTQQWFAVIYCFFFTCLAGFFLSITWMVRALQTPKKFWLYYLPSLFLMAYCVLASEFFFGLELVRGAILWLVISRTQHGFWTRVWQTIRYWGAYLLIFAGFSIWRAFFFVSVNHGVEIVSQFNAHPKTALFDSLRKTYQAAVDALLNSWINPFSLKNYPAKGIMAGLILFVGVVVLVGLFFWLRKQGQPAEEETQTIRSNWQKEAFWIGLLSLAVSVLPFWAADLEINYLYPFDRFMLAYLMGSSLMVVALLEFFSENPQRTHWVVVTLVAAGAAYQLANANVYKNLWSQQKELYWQLNWRIPALKPNTALLSWTMPNEAYYSGYALSAQLNWTYADSITKRRTPYEFILLSSAQAKEIPSLTPDSDILSNFRTYTFKGNTSKSLYVYFDGANCVRILDDNVTPAISVLSDYNKTTLTAINRSNLAQILEEGTNHPPLNVIGKEPAHTWCYYFEKAELARQFKQYDQVIALLNEARTKGYDPEELSEWYPFIDAYLHQGDLVNAESLSKAALAPEDKIYENGVCHLWNAYRSEQKDSISQAKLDPYLIAFHCQ